MQSATSAVSSLNAQFHRAHQLVHTHSRGAMLPEAPRFGRCNSSRPAGVIRSTPYAEPHHTAHTAMMPAQHPCPECSRQPVPTAGTAGVHNSCNSPFQAISGSQEWQQQQHQGDAASCSRRAWLLGVGAAGAAGLSCLLTPQAAQAALVQFPCAELRNKYILIRAGESYSESQDTILTNPAWKTSMAAGLSERGKAQVVRQTIPSMQALGICGEAGCWLWPSVTQNSYQTAEILAGVLGVGRSRIVPEYSFLDARGVGALEGLRLNTVYQQVWDGDGRDANWHPPKGYDGTPPESVADVLTRMRQLLSVTETQYTGQDVVIITPDSDTLSILQAAVLGLDIRRHSELAMKPGEVRPLLLSRQQPDTQPRTIPCPRPPACV